MRPRLDQGPPTARSGRPGENHAKPLPRLNRRAGCPRPAQTLCCKWYLQNVCSVYGRQKLSAKRFPYSISRSNPTPIYRQIADQLRHRIVSDEFAKSQKLPSNRELAERL